jgi:hypothetical protein
MTRAKSKPSIPTREFPSARRPTSNAKASAEPRPAKKAKVKAAPAKALKATAIKPSQGAALRAAPAKAAPAKPASAKPATGKPVSAKAPLAKPAAIKASAAKATPLKPAPAKLAPVKALLVKAVAAKAAAAKAVIVDTPAKIRPIEQAVGVSSDAVARRTGKSWAQWFALLDAAGAAELDHKGIVAVLAQRHGVGPWWQQMVTTAYEQARGKNGTQAAEEGFQVDLVKTLELPLAKLFRFWSEPAERNKWLCDDRFSIHKATASKSIRARWGRGVSRIDVDFLEKGPTKSQVTVQHNRIETSDAAEQMKAYWAKKISALEALLTRV